MTDERLREAHARYDSIELDRFNEQSARAMRRRLDDGAVKFGALDWRNNDYTDNQNAARLVRAVDHLFGVLRKWRDPVTAEFIDAAELRKRAADVANQAFMLADPLRQEGDEPFTYALAATPEPPMLDAAYVRKVLGDHHRLLQTSARNCAICWHERARLSHPGAER